jgi:manganese/iron transport system substrate-binding protein
MRAGVNPWACLRVMVAAVSVGLLSACSRVGTTGASTPLGTAGLTTMAANSLQPVDLSSGRLLRVTATTGLLAEAVRAVGGSDIDLSVLVPTGGDPHDYELSPQDVVRLHDSDVIFMSGLGYEVFLAKLMSGDDAHPPIVALSDGIVPLEMAVELGSQPAAAGEAKPGEYDPHVWFDPNSVIQWTENAATAMAGEDPAHASQYQANAAAYINQLKELDQWGADQVNRLPADQRKLVGDHEVLGYLARRYGFTVVGAITSEASDVAEPSAQQVAALETTLKEQGVRAVFVGVFDNHSLANQIGQDTGVRVVPIYFESLSPAGGPATTYLDFFRYDLSQIVEALK